MADSNVLSWTPANWLTVLLMGALGFAIIGMIAKIIKQKQATS